MDFCYEMTSFDGYTVTIYGEEDGPAYVEYFDHDLCERRTRKFEDGETAAYCWAWRRGYRE